MKEEWKFMVGGYDGNYIISNYGKIISLNEGNNKRNPTIKKTVKDKNGYERVPLRKNGKSTYALVHRLVAMAFIPNPENLPMINHKDETRDNNRVDNLEWCDALYNNNYGNARLRKMKPKTMTEKRIKSAKENGLKKKKKIDQYDLEGNFIQTFDSAKDLGNVFHCSPNAFTNCCKGISRTSHGYIWKYHNEEKGD